MADLPKHARVVIIGGGIIGCSTAYHLTKLGWKDVVIVERKKVASGTSWAASGLVGQLWADEALTRLAKYGTELFDGLEADTGQATGWKQTGSLRVAHSEHRVHEFDRSMDLANSFGIEMERISLEEAKNYFPLMDTSDLKAAWYQPNDGFTNPEDTTQALAKGARQGGALIVQDCEVTKIVKKDGTITGVQTTLGDVECDYVVCCAGMWGTKIGKMAGVSLPLHAAEHMHMTTNPVEGCPKLFPYLRDMDKCIYIRPEGGGLLLGGFEPVAKPWGAKGVPNDFEFTQLQEDWDQFEMFLENAVEIVPAFAEAEVNSLTTVPESFTPDCLFMLGEAPGVKNFFVASGMNSVGISSSGGAGKALAQWMDQGYPEEDLWPVDVRRFDSWANNQNFLTERAYEATGMLYWDHFPFRQPETGRNIRRTPIHDRLAGEGACFGQVQGWERANWFAKEGQKAEYEYSWSKQNWFDNCGEELMAMREGVGMYELSSLAKFMVEGKDAMRELQKICANNVEVPIGKVVYTQMCNERGGIESDITVTRIGEDKFFLATPGATGTRDMDWIKRHIDPDARAICYDVSNTYTMLAVMGPKSRELLNDICPQDLSNEAFPFGTAQQLDVGLGKPFAIRLSFVGELGWELYCPVEQTLAVYEAIMKVGPKHGLKLVGMHAVDCGRIEKGYKHWGSDIGPDDTPVESGLGFAVNYNCGDFIGRDALVAQKEAGHRRRLVNFVVQDPEVMIYHDEPVYRNGELHGENTHGAYSYVMNGSMGMFYVHDDEKKITKDFINDAKYEIKVEGKLYPIKVYMFPPYDPKSENVKK
ncbi:MAG: FAD-dependent oxidoreductase [Flavobacteriales bacterium]|nr:FAD-dependent oxidoreductase [Flavobacteriales bacterium]